MIKRFILTILIIIVIFLFSSCNKSNGKNATIQIWCYDFGGTGLYSNALASILANSKLFCEKNGIPLEIFKYDNKTLSYEDYVLKRNTATAKGNMIVIEDARYMHDIAKQHADYTQLENYGRLLSAYKEKYCIPLGVGYTSMYINNDAINYYNINTDKTLITYDEYLNIKNLMKEKGAKFKLNSLEFYEIVEYYLNINNLRFINENSEVLKDNNKFKESLKKAIVGICDDIILYHDGLYDIVDENQETSKREYLIYDENSKMKLCDSDSLGGYSLINYDGVLNLGESIINKTFVIYPKTISFSPCFYMYKKITNDKIYDLANYIVSESSYLYIAENNRSYAPVFNTDRIRKFLELDETWKYIGSIKMNADRGQEKDKKVYDFINKSFELLVKNEDSSNLIANYYYINNDLHIRIMSFINDFIKELSNQNFDYKNEEVNKMIDNKIDEFIFNFNVHYN